MPPLLGAPGWFPDPFGPAGMWRYWDGTRWTQAAQPAQQQPSTPPEEQWARLPFDSGAHATPPMPPPPPVPHSHAPQPPARPAAAPHHHRKARGGTGWVWALIAALVLIIVLAAAAFVLFRDGDEPAGPGATKASTAAAKSPVIGTVRDTEAGIAYAKLGAPWETAAQSWETSGFTGGQTSVVQAPFEEYASFNATSLSGLPTGEERSGYRGPDDLDTVAQRATDRILTNHFAMTSLRKKIFAGPVKAGPRSAWLERIRLDFPDARSRNWKFTADTVAVLAVDVDGTKVALLWVSLPDTFANQGDIDQVLASVQPL